MAWLYKRQGNGVYYLGFYHNGFEKRISLKTTSKTIAKEIKAKIEHEMTSGRFNLSGYSAKDRRLETFLNEALEYSRVNKGAETYERDQRVKKTFIKFSGNTFLRNITAKHIEKYKLYRTSECGIANTTVNIELRHLSSMFSLAVKYGYLSENPFKSVKKLPVNKKLPVYLTTTQAAKLLTYLENRVIYPSVLIALSTGARISEVCRLEWPDIKFRSKTLVLDGKGRKERVVPIPDTLMDYLKKNKEKTGFVIKSSRSRDEITRQFRQYADEVGLNGFKFHNLRDTYASWLVQQGVHLKVIQELLGHEDIKTTMIYAHIAPDNKLDAIDKINKMI